MAVGDHRYAEDEWIGVIGRILLDRRRRIQLVYDPEAAAERWGFCRGGRAFLRLLNVIVRHTGAEPVQRLTDRYLRWLERDPHSALTVSAYVIKLLFRPGVARVLDRAASELGYEGERSTRTDRSTGAARA